MRGHDKLERYLKRNPHPHYSFFQRPYLTRRSFVNLLGAGVTASYLTPAAQAVDILPWASVETKSTARNVIFILLAGAASHIDTFDYKMVEGVQPASFQPEAINGITWPTGLLPKIGSKLGDIAIVRSVRSWALQHGGMQTWVQIGRSPTAVLGSVAPNIGSIVAAELESQRTEGQVFPTFLALNAFTAVGSGFLPSHYAPVKVNASATGLTNTTHPAVGGQGRFDARYHLVEELDAPLRIDSPIGQPMEDFDSFYKSARGLMYNPAVESAFGFTAEESERYGGSGFGNACLVAAKVLASNQGTRYIQIIQGGWDHHQDIYTANVANKLPALARNLDDGYSALIDDLKRYGLFGETMIVLMGEFGRTVGALSPQAGRDHYLQQFVTFAGGGVHGGKTIGSTDPTGAATAEPGWHRDRDVRIEDIEATLYSALGINWTNVRYDDPFGRGFEYVPKSKDDVYGPIDELWG